MKLRDPLIVLGTVFLLGLSTPSTAATGEEEAALAAESAKQAQLEAAYKDALAGAENERLKAEASMERAHEQLRLVAEQRARSNGDREQARAVQAAEMAKMQEELEQARRQLRETSREIARVNSEVAWARASGDSSIRVFRSSDRPILGVILGDSTDVGVKILGVSPDGPSERAGLKQGDFIIAFDGRVLAATDETGDALSGLNIALKEIKAGEPVIVSVERDEKTLDLAVVPEIREPLGWHTITRFPSAPRAPGAPGAPTEVITIERIEIPEIDTVALAEQIEQIRIEVAERGRLLAHREPLPHDEYEFEFHEMSDLGDRVLHQANVWFGLPMTQGLKLAEIDPGLGEYFKTDRGVLVLKAKSDNDLQLESGDVILQVGDTEVNSPAEFMRALREVESGEELTIDIKRNRKDKTLKTTMPEKQFSYFSPGITTKYNVQISTETD